MSEADLATSVPGTRLRDAVRERPRHRVRARDQHRAHHQRRAGVRGAEDEPLADGVEKDGHEQQVGDALDESVKEVAASLAREQERPQVGRLSYPGIGPPCTDPERGRNRRLQEEAKPTRTREPLRDVLEKRPGKEVEAAALVGIAQRSRELEREHEKHQTRQDERQPPPGPHSGPRSRARPSPCRSSSSASFLSSRSSKLLRMPLSTRSR